jgi:hypothetical protein|nr:MAG TPA: hypothetical protein [Caudoviricetes sp.]
MSQQPTKTNEMIISLSELTPSQRTQVVRIDGKVYTLRSLGAGDQLDIQRATRKLLQLNTTMVDLQERAQNESQLDNAQKISLIDELSDKFNELEMVNQELLKCYARAIDDGTKAQKDTQTLVETLGVEGVRRLFERAFGSDQ